ncbi:MAG: adenylate/guanylate cyclase domain-containing protein [Treponemataceae bacterium]|nr:adenylate/guanylate cyclase domain-containing protein [Treponemataceae bacterium]
MGFIGVTGIFERLENVAYDFLMHVKGPTEQNPDIMLLNVDDIALEEVGTWPWSRDVIAGVLVRLKELGANRTVFDIEYLSPGQVAIDQATLEQLPDKFSDSMSTVSEVIDEFSTAVSRGQIPPSAAGEVSTDLINSYVIPSYQDLYDSVAGNLVIDNDANFAKAIRYFGNTWMTIGIAEINIKVDDEYKNFIYTNFLDYDITDENDLVDKDNTYNYIHQQNLVKGFSPAIPKLMKNAAGAGFTNVIIDKDGSRRRVELLHKNDDHYIAQLSFAPLLDYLDTKTLIRKGKSIIVKDALFPGEEERRDIKIPLDEHGRMLINWLPQKFLDSFKNDSIYWVIYLDDIEASLVSNLENLSSFQLKDSKGRWLPYYDAINYLLQEYSDCQMQKSALINDSSLTSDDIRYEKLFTHRKAFFTDCAELLDPYFLDGINQRIDELTTPENKADMQDIKDALKERFEVIKSDLELYNSEFAKLESECRNAFIIIGNSAQGTTDLGTTPFYRAYPNVGTHANVCNTIITENFIKTVRWYWAFLISALMALGLLFFRKAKHSRYENSYGITCVFIQPVFAILMMRIFRIYIPFSISTLLMFVAFLGLFILHFVNSNRDKKFITNAFGQCLSPAVVQEIVDNPDSFKLGGESLEMTAIFTDIQKFSSFSELLTASQLVALLNYYLTKMSDIILDERGTVDKYEGDAIVAFIGAPIKCADHASRAVRSAIKMKASEIEMNAEIKKIASGPKPEEMDKDLYDAFCIMVKNGKNIFTRIGINSGEMIAGYMGSQGKKNYTMMGNNVNLASRLEGVNKQYSTGGILISEATKNLLDDTFLLRRLDRVRVVNVNTPIQLYEPLCEKERADDNLLKYVEAWEKAVDMFEKKEYDKALALFKKLSEVKKDDKTAVYYAGLLENFFTKGKYPREADDVGVEYNPEDGVFKLLQK